jgi:adenosylmethionine-8-amino-7-oxononanoate aminotransferase
MTEKRSIENRYSLWNPDSNGCLPVSATLVSEKIYKGFPGAENYFFHGSTHTRHPVCTAVALANSDIIINEKWIEKAARVGSYLKSRLMELMDKHPIVRDMRGRGLMVAIELAKDRPNNTLLTKQETIGIAIDIILRGIVRSFSNNILKLLPPLIIDETIAGIMAKIVARLLHLDGKVKIGCQVRFAKGFCPYPNGIHLPVIKKVC